MAGDCPKDVPDPDLGFMDCAIRVCDGDSSIRENDSSKFMPASNQYLQVWH